MPVALRLATDAPNTVAIIDSRLAGLQSQPAGDALTALERRVPVVVMGMGHPTLYAAPYLRAGASGYWAKGDELAALVGLPRTAADRQPPAA